MCSADVFLGLLAILFPPLPVWVKRGICSADSLINILLCMLGFLPGLLHAWYIIANYPEPDYDYQSLPQDTERVTYVFVHGPPPPGQHNAQYQSQRAPKPSGDNNNSRTYGTNSANASGGQNPQPQPQQQAGAGEGSSDGAAPPSYAQVVAGDNKVQTHD
ncbi:hypothetical protein RB595_002182 [Gaeumannomyces hyphopodioides]